MAFTLLNFSLEAAHKSAQSKSGLSAQQQQVIEWVKTGEGNAFVEAVAGSGKTTTLIEACSVMTGSVAFAAFNKKIADEIKEKVAKKGLGNVKVGTFHSFGLAAWKRIAPAAIVDASMKSKLMIEACEVERPMQAAVKKLVSLAKQSAYGLAWVPEESDDEAREWATVIDHFDVLSAVDWKQLVPSASENAPQRLVQLTKRCLSWSRANSMKMIDFDDMLWLPVVEKCPMQQFDFVLVDEAQDTNVTRRMLAEKMVRPGGRTLWVGDRFQSIYGFTGADSDAVDQIIESFNATQLPLTVTFRCSKAATEFAQTWVPQIVAHESNAQGAVISLDLDEATKWNAGAVTMKPGEAILCRNTRPLVSLAFAMIRRGIACYVEGRDIGRSLTSLVDRWKVTSINGLVTMLEEYRQREISKAMAQDNEAKVDAINDRIDTLVTIMDGCATLDEIRQRIEKMFGDSGEPGTARQITLSTIHKAKGREWARVAVLGWNQLMPSKWAKQPWQVQQEENLMYVAATRTKGDLLIVDLIEEGRK